MHGNFFPYHLFQINELAFEDFFSVLWIRIGFNADQDPAFYLNEDPDQDLGSQTNADPSHPDPGLNAPPLLIC